MTESAKWLRPSDLEKMIGVSWTRPRRSRILQKLEDAGVTVSRPAPGVTLIDEASFIQYMRDVRDRRVPQPDWVNEIQHWP